MTCTLAAALLAATLSQTAADAGVDAPSTDGGQDEVAREVVQATADAARASAFEELAQAIARMQKADARLKDFTATFVRQEYKGGKLLPQETIALKYRAAPLSLYLRWGTGSSAQEVLWRRGWNDDRLRAHPGSFPDFTVNLKTDSWLAMRGARHPIFRAGFSFMIEMFARDLVTTRAKPSCLGAVKDEGVQDVLAAKARCFEMSTDKESCPEVYAYRARLCVHEELAVPIRIQVWDREDGEVRLVEDYAYGDVKLDVGLRDKDFDPKNDEYRF